jgi:hypothetical protein
MKVSNKVDLPHNFPSLRNGHRKPVLICGAGMSFGLAPSLDDLRKKCDQAEKKLKCSIPRNDGDLDKPGYLYDWAEQIYQQLLERQEPLPKLKIADALGILDNPAWLGKVDMPLRGTWPRHRVVARFAREKRWHKIWSLNWDCLLEVGLESVGFDEHPLLPQQPWPTTYVTNVTHHDALPSADDDTVTVYKPHGCVKSLLKAEEEYNKGNYSEAERLAKRFVITKTELSELEKKFRDPDPTAASFCCRLHLHLQGYPLLIVGWSVSERYFIKLASKALNDQPPRNTCDELTIVAPRFKNGHKQLAKYYDRGESTAHVKVSRNSDGFSTDRLFLWIQTLHALECLRKHSMANSDDIQTIYNRFQKPVCEDFVISWVDNFLPAWVRLCWRAGLVPYIKNGKQIPKHSIRIEKPDEHIPWGIDGIPRPDLFTAAHLLARIGANAKGWDFNKFPGGLWKGTKGLLVIPLPAWGQRSNLSGLRPLLRQLEQDIGYVRELSILPLHHDITAQITEDVIAILKIRVASLTRKIQFASITETQHIKIYPIDAL